MSPQRISDTERVVLMLCILVTIVATILFLFGEPGRWR